MIDPSIARGVTPIGAGVPEYLNQLQQQGNQNMLAQNQNALSQYQLDSARRGDQQQTAINNLAQSNPNASLQDFTRAGGVAGAAAYNTLGQASAQSNQYQLLKQANTLRQVKYWADVVAQDPSRHDEAAQHMSELGIPFQPAAGRSPQEIQAQAKQASTGIQQQLDSLDSQLVDPKTRFEANSAANIEGTKSTTSLAISKASIEAENARASASRDVTMRGQNQEVVPVTNPDGSVTYMPKSQAAGQKVGSAAMAAGMMTPEMGNLAAALAERGIALPAGFRSQAQQRALYAGLLARNPDKSADQVADLVKAGKIDLAGEMKEITTAGGIAGKVAYAENELTQSVPLALQSSAKVSRVGFVPISKLLQMADSSINDPALLDLKIKTQSVMNAYDMLAARSGTDVKKREAAHELLTSANTPEAYAAGMKAFMQEAAVAKKAGAMSMKPNVAPSDTSGQTLTYDPATGTFK